MKTPPSTDDILLLIGRTLIAALFLAGAAQKLFAPDIVIGMLASVGLPALTVWPVALFNAVAATALMTGWQFGKVTKLLALYCVLTAYFHWQLRADPWQVTIVLKNLAIAGGLLAFGVSGPGRLVPARRRTPPPPPNTAPADSAAARHRTPGGTAPRDRSLR